MTRSRWGLCMAVVLALPACSSPRLDTGPAHPASTEAAAAPLISVGSALDPNFDPQPAAAPSAAAPAAYSEHAHEPAAEKQAPPAAYSEHAHEPAAEKQAPPAATQWTCPMHPEIIRSEPGNCPICGMKLKPVPPKDGVKGSP